MKALRERHQLTQKQLADILGTSPQYVSHMERGEKISDQMIARLSEWDGNDDEPAAKLDELPEPPYNPGEQPEPSPDSGSGDDEEERPRRRRSSSPRRKTLTAWQEEAALRLIALTQGEKTILEVNGQQVEIVVPGLCHLIAQADQYDAAVVGNGAPAFWTAVVKVAPRHPWLRSIIDMLTMGGEYGELSRAALAIAVPILMHHGVIPMPRPKLQAVLEEDGGAAA